MEEKDEHDQNSAQQRRNVRLPIDHPLHAYIDDTKALIKILMEDDEKGESCSRYHLFKNTAELTFLRKFVTQFHSLLASGSSCAGSENSFSGDEDHHSCFQRDNESMKDHGKTSEIIIESHDDGIDSDDDDDDYWKGSNEITKDTYTVSRTDKRKTSTTNKETARLLPPPSPTTTPPLSSSYQLSSMPPADEKHDTAKSCGSSNHDSSVEAYECIIIGGGASGIGVAVSLLAGGMHPSNLLVVESHEVGNSFTNWPEHTRFISPSFYSDPFGPIDLNSIDPGWIPSPLSSPSNFIEDKNNGGGLSGVDYASYLRSVCVRYGIPVREHASVSNVSRINGNDDSVWKGGAFAVTTTEEAEMIPPCKGENTNDQNQRETIKLLYSRFVVWAGGEYSYPQLFPNASFQQGSYLHYTDIKENWNHLSSLSDSTSSSDKNLIVIGSFESGIDTTCALVTFNEHVRVTLVQSPSSFSPSDLNKEEEKKDTEEGTIDPSMKLSDSSKSRFQRAMKTNRITVTKNALCAGTATSHDNVFTAKLELKQRPSSTNAAKTNESGVSASYREISSNMPIILCTGFDVSQICKNNNTNDIKTGVIGEKLYQSNTTTDQKDGILSSTLDWNMKINGPAVNQSCDESLKCPGLFVSGPMLRHEIPLKPNKILPNEHDKNKNTTTTQQMSSDMIPLHSSSNGLTPANDDNQGGQTITNNNMIDENDESIEVKNILVDSNKLAVSGADIIESHNNTAVSLVFCFVYKYRTRFALVAGEIISRLIYEDHNISHSIFAPSDDGNEIVPKTEQPIIIDKVGHQRLERLESMLSFYKERGMLLTDLSCACSCGSENC